MKPNPLLDGREFLSDRKYGYLDRAGRVLIPGEYDLAWSFSEGLAVVQIGDGIAARYGYIDANGNKVIPLTLTSASSFKDRLALVRRRGRKWREVTLVIDPAGKVVLEMPHRGLEPFSEGLAAVWSGHAFGFMDIKGHWAIEPQFDQAEPFKNGLAEVQRGDWYGLIDAAGNFAWGTDHRGCGESSARMGMDLVAARTRRPGCIARPGLRYFPPRVKTARMASLRIAARKLAVAKERLDMQPFGCIIGPWTPTWTRCSRPWPIPAAGCCSTACTPTTGRRSGSSANTWR